MPDAPIIFQPFEDEAPFVGTGPSACPWRRVSADSGRWLRIYPHWKERRLVEVGLIKLGEALEQRDLEAMELIDVTLAEIARNQKAMAEHTGERA